jgi:thiol-disulfide isomerase/thioredoxin
MAARLSPGGFFEASLRVFSLLRIAIVWLCSLAPAALAAGELKPWPGGDTPALEIKDIGGANHRLEDYRGKVVLLNFWATWCVPCREEMPSIGRLKKTLADRPFVVLAVNVDEPESRVAKFLAQMPLDFPTLLDPGGRTTRAWKVRILPASFLIAPNGRIRYTVTGELDWANKHIVRSVSELLPATDKQR